MESKISFREYLKSIQIVYSALLMGQIIFGIIATVLINLEEAELGKLDLQGVYSFIMPIIVIASIVSSYIVFQKRLVDMKETIYLNNKLDSYRAALIVRWALLEGPSFLSIIVFLLTGDYFVLGMAGMIIAFFIYIFPSKQRVETDLDLSWEEKLKLNE